MCVCVMTQRMIFRASDRPMDTEKQKVRLLGSSFVSSSWLYFQKALIYRDV